MRWLADYAWSRWSVGCEPSALAWKVRSEFFGFFSLVQILFLGTSVFKRWKKPLITDQGPMTVQLVKGDLFEVLVVKLGKAARGKHRWIGLTIHGQKNGRDACEEVLTKQLGGLKFQLYDCISDSDHVSAIIKVALGDYREVLTRIESADLISSRTSSGKIRLVRERMEIVKTIRKS